MDTDELRSREPIRESGGPIFVQDEASSDGWGMPGLVARADLAERILPPDENAPTLVGCACSPQPTRRAARNRPAHS